MIPQRERELVAIARGGKLVHLLHLRGRVSIRQAARILECGERNIYLIVDKLSSGDVPITLVDGYIILAQNSSEIVRD